jgi:hypothetical protein
MTNSCRRGIPDAKGETPERAHHSNFAVHRFINILRRSSTMAKVLVETRPHLD